MLLRTFLFFGVVLLLGVGIDGLAQNPGVLEVQWHGYKISTTAAFAVISLGVLGLFVAMLTSFYLWLMGAPKRLKTYWAYKRQEQGFLAFNAALQALALGEDGAAIKAAKEAHKLLPNLPLADTLLAEVITRNQAGQTTPLNQLEARKEYQKLLEKPHTKVLGLRGLLAESLQQANSKQALTYAIDFYREKPKSPYILNILTHLYARQQQLAEALFYAEKYVKIAPPNTKDFTQAHFVHGCLLRLYAQQLGLSGQIEDALKVAEKGVKLYPAFSPLVVHLANLYDQQGQTVKAQKTLTKAYKKAPYLKIGRTWLAMHKNLKEAVLLKKLDKLTAPWPEVLATAILKAEAFITLRQYAEARRVLEQALVKGDDRTLFQTMAELELAQQPQSPQAAKWLQKALTAPNRLKDQDGQTAAFENWRRQLVENPLPHLQNLQMPLSFTSALAVYAQESTS